MLTPDDRQPIFEAAPDAQGDCGQARLDVPSHIYREDLPDGQPRKLASGFTDIPGMEISPNGRHLAVAARRDRPPTAPVARADRRSGADPPPRHTTT